MSESTVDLNLQEQIARIENLREEGFKFMAEQRKLSVQEMKFAAEQRKLYEEALKLRGDRWLAPALAVVGVLGAASGLLSVLHAIGAF